MATTTEQDRVRELQRALYRAAKADPERRFHALYDKVHRRDVLERAWESVRANRGAAGIDRTTLADVERYGIDRLLDELVMDLRDGRWRPLPARRVFIPKPGREELRPLSIPAVRDRIVQAAVKAVIEPIFEADFVECSFGFRPKRSAHDALQVLIDESWRGRRTRGCGVLVRYADDLVVMCRTEAEAERALAALGAVLAELGLELKEAKTRIVHLCEGGEGLDFLGFHHRWVRARGPRVRHVTFLARWPSRAAMQHARDRVRELTAHERLLLPVEQVVQDLNRYLRGWAGYFRYGNSARHFNRLEYQAVDRLVLFVANRHRRSRAYGRWAVLYRSPGRLGLITLAGTVVAPSPERAWRG